MNRIHLLIAVLVCCVLPHAFAQDTAPSATVAASAQPEPLSLSLEDAVTMAQRNNLSMRADRLKLEEARTGDAASWNAFLPQISLTGAVSRSNLRDEQLLQPDVTGFPQYAASGFTGAFPTLAIPRWGAQFLLDISWSLSAAQFLSVKQTALEYQRGQISTQIAEKSLARQVKQ